MISVEWFARQTLIAYSRAIITLGIVVERSSSVDNHKARGDSGMSGAQRTDRLGLFSSSAQFPLVN